MNKYRSYFTLTRCNHIRNAGIIIVGIIIVALFVGIFISASSPTVPSSGVVQEVYDGDTVLLASGQRVRYTGIDTAERGEEYHDNASRFNKQLVLGKKVRLEYDKEKIDRYKRLLAYVFVEENGKEVLVNKRILEEGYAGMYYARPQMRYFKELLAAQQYAITHNLAIWRYKLLETEKEYVGSKKSYTFHRKNCKGIYRLKPSNKIVFKSKKDAFLQGYSPCRTCKP